MKLFKNVAFSVTLLLTTSLLISAFIILYSFSSFTSKNEVKENFPVNTTLVSGPSVELKSPATISK